MPESQVISHFFRLVNNRDLEGMGGLLGERAEFHFPKTQPLLGKDRILRFFAVLFRQYPELLFEIHTIITEGNKAAVHWKNRGGNRRRESYENEGVSLLELEGDRIRFISDFFKDTEKF